MASPAVRPASVDAASEDAYRVLHLEDSDLDAAFVSDRLKKGGIAADIVRVEGRRPYVEMLQKERFDLILSDYQIPSIEGLEALELAIEYQPETPFIFVSGAMGEELAIEALQQGATDYVLKQRLVRLPGAFTRAIAEKVERDRRIESEKALRERDEWLRFLARLSEATQPLSAPDKIMATTARLLAEYLNVDRCAYAEVEGESVFHITGDHSIGVPSVVGRWPVAAFGKACVEAMLGNEAYVVDDTLSDPRIGREDIAAYEATTIRAVICVPLHKEGRFTAAMAVHQAVPRVWKPSEIRLVTNVVSRCWEALERSRAALAEQRMHAEILLEQQRLEEVFRLAPSFMAVLRGPQHVFERANDRYLNLVGGRPLIGRTVREALPEIADQGFIEILDGVYATGAPYSATGVRVLLEEGTARLLEERILEFVYHPMRDSHGIVSGILVQGIDLTERHRAESLLRSVTLESQRKQRLYETALSNTPDFVYVFDLEHRFTYVNEAILKMWGKTWNEAIGKTCLELGYEPWHAEMHNREIDQVRATRRPIRGEVPFTGTNGRRIYDYIFVPVLGSDGEVEAVAGTTRDITDRQAMEQELREMDRKKDDFIALLAHELRNPLAPIRNGLQVLQMTDDPQVHAEFHEMMDRQLTHMVRLVDDLLDVSRIGREKMQLQKSRVSLAAVIESAIETARPAIDNARHVLSVSLPDHPVLLDADLTRLAQVFSNLLTNSAKYTPPAGRIEVVARLLDDIIEISVVDNGIGIPPESLGTVFDMFSQVDRPVERRTGGLGIGLALVKALVEMHGGEVRVENLPVGSRFTVRLPMTPSGEEDSAVCFTPVAGRSPHKVLVVDDNQDGAQSMAAMLRILGSEVRTAHDGHKGIAEAQAFGPEVILMDIGMPSLNGIDATRLIRSHEWGRSIKIIALTGWGQERDRRQSREAGCDGHLVKPVSLTDLQKTLAELTIA